jgi:hypothetical protein
MFHNLTKLPIKASHKLTEAIGSKAKPQLRILLFLELCSSVQVVSGNKKGKICPQPSVS